MAPSPFKIVIVGAGPAGLATALALIHQRKNDDATTASPVHITLLERRESVQTLGGAINLTPLALRYLDSMGAGKALREASSPVSSIELVGHRLGNLLVKLWPGVDAIRILRQTLVEGLLAALKEQSSDDGDVTIVYGAKITTMEQFGSEDSTSEGVRVAWAQNGTEHTTDAHLLIGCDGIHSQVRNALVDPDREKTYAGRSNAYGYAKVTPEEATRWTRSDGEPLIKDTTLIQNGGNSLLVTYFQKPEERDALYLASLTPTPEPSGGSREGWSVLGADKEGIKQSILDNYKNGPLTCLPDILDRCQEWFFFPIYMLSPGGRWSKGRVQLLGDAAHAMPPQGESTGVAIEDGILMAHVLSRRDSRTVPQMLADYEQLRRKDIDTLYITTMRRFQTKGPTSWLGLVAWDWLAWFVCSYTNWTSDHFARDVRFFDLPE